MKRPIILWCTLLAVSINFSVLHAQLLTNPVPPEYDVPMQRLLVFQTGHYIDGVTQGQIGLDSSMIYAADIFKLNRLLVCNERYDAEGKSVSGKLIGDGKIMEAKTLLSASPADKQQQILAELTGYYIHRSGQEKKDLEQADVFLTRLKEVSKKTKNQKWQLEALMLEGNLDSQRGQLALSRDIFSSAAAGYKTIRDTLGWITALSEQATRLPFGNKEKLSLLEEALHLSKKAKLRIREVRVVTEITTDHMHTNPATIKAELIKLFELQKALGFKHLQYTQNVITYFMVLHRDMTEALHSAQETLRYMEETHDRALATLYYQRITEVYGNMAQDSMTSYWNLRALQNRTKETEVFWYKSFLARMNWLNNINRGREALALADSITAEFPPQTLFDRMHLALNMGFSFWKTHQPQKADAEFSKYLELKKQFPPELLFAEGSWAMIPITRFYLEDMHDYKRARIFAEIGITEAIPMGNIAAMSDFHWVLFKIDSTEGNYLASIDHLRQHRIFYDSMYNREQRKKVNELRVQFETGRKDQDIKYLRQQGELKESRLQQASLTQNIILAGVFLLLVILGLLFSQYRAKQRTNEQLRNKQQEISRKNEELEQLVEDKEWLVKEIHHRVKNNLHTIVSLLESQSAYLGDDALTAVRDSQHRVYAMSLIHQKLYLSEDVTTVNMDIYVKELVSYLQESFDISQRVRFIVDTNNISLDAGTAIPLGLILNEAITNAIKYAFPDRTGLITVNLGRTRDLFELTIHDDGIGLPPDFDMAKSKTLGMRLMKGLTKELSGTFGFKAGSGTTVSVMFIETVLRRLREIQQTDAEV